MQQLSLFKLYFIFLKIGAILLGGGYVILPILKHELIEKEQILSDNELINYFTLSQSLPGIVAANISTFIGYKLRGKLGALFALLGIITIPFFIILLLYFFLDVFTDNIYLESVLWGVNIAVLILILLSCKEVYQASKKNILFYTIFLAGIITLILYNMPPVEFIIMFLIIGFILNAFIKRIK